MKASSTLFNYSQSCDIAQRITATLLENL